MTSQAQPIPPGLFASAAIAAAGAVAAAVLGPFLARSGIVPIGLGEAIFRCAIPMALAAVVVAIVAMRRSGRRLGGLVVIGVAVAAAALPIRTWHRGPFRAAHPRRDDRRRQSAALCRGRAGCGSRRPTPPTTAARRSPATSARRTVICAR